MSCMAKKKSTRKPATPDHNIGVPSVRKMAQATKGAKKKRASTRRKQARTFSLSKDVIDTLECYRAERRLNSLTSAVEELVREAKKAHLASRTKAYYDSLSDEEVKQQEQWGAFSESQM